MKVNHIKTQATIPAVVGLQDDECGRNLMFF